jgi:hypothetical protein
MIRTLVFLVLGPLLVAGSIYDSVDREAARRLARVADDAKDEEQMAAAREIAERAVELWPDTSDARRLLLFEKNHKTREWERKLSDRVDVIKWEDKDPKEAAVFRGDALEIEKWRSRRYVRVWSKQDEKDRDPKVLEALLIRTPREPAVHEALGHPRVGDLYVRPELAPLLRRRETVVKRWKACRELPFEAKRAEAPFPVPGVPNELPTWVCEDQVTVASFPDEDTKALAVETQRTYALIARILGTKAVPWAPYRLVLLDGIGYRRMIYALYDDPEEQATRLRFSSYEHQDFVALMAETTAKARDTISHTLAYKTIQLAVAPGEADNRDPEPYAFIKEGFGYFVSLTLYNSAATWFHSGTESSSKVRKIVPAPEEKNEASLTRWLQGLARSGDLVPLPEVFGRSLNSLDELSSFEAWSFIRFLLLYDDVAFRNLVLSLREKEKGSAASRVLESLKQAYKKEPKELERLWLAWLLEIEG